MTPAEFHREALADLKRRRQLVSDEYADPGADSDEELRRMMLHQRLSEASAPSLPPGLVQGEASEAEEGQPDDDEAEEEDDAPPPVPEWRPVAIRQPEFRDEDEMESSDDPNYCFLCDCTENHIMVYESDNYKRMRALLYENYGITDIKWLIPTAQDLYNTGVRVYTKDRRPWFKRVIHEHLTHHHPTPRAIVEQQLQTFNHMLRTLEASGVVEESTIVPGRRRLNTTYASLYKELCKEMRPMIQLVMKLRPQK